MKLFVSQLTCIVLAFSALFLLIARFNRRHLDRIDGKLAAEYSGWTRLSVVVAYGAISVLPLSIASSLKEGGPFADRLTFVAIHLLFFIMILWAFNRRVVVGACQVGISNLFGVVKIIPDSDLRGATVTRAAAFLASTNFTGAKYKISVDDHMHNCREVLVEIEKRIVRKMAS